MPLLLKYSLAQTSVKNVASSTVPLVPYNIVPQKIVNKYVFVSKLNRESIDLLKEHFRDDVPKDDWKLVVKIKKLLGIM